MKTKKSAKIGWISVVLLIVLSLFLGQALSGCTQTGVKQLPQPGDPPPTGSTVLHHSETIIQDQANVTQDLHIEFTSGLDIEDCNVKVDPFPTVNCQVVGAKVLKVSASGTNITKGGMVTIDARIMVKGKPPVSLTKKYRWTGANGTPLGNVIDCGDVSSMELPSTNNTQQQPLPVPWTGDGIRLHNETLTPPPSAHDLHIEFRLINGNAIKGWEVNIDTNPAPAQTSQRADTGINVDAREGGIATGCRTRIAAKFLVMGNRGQITKRYWWTDVNGTRLGNIIDCGVVAFAEPSPSGTPGEYNHVCTITNPPDATAYLNVTGLAFLPSMDYYEDLCNITFPPPYHDFTLAPGENWSTNVTTLGPLYGGYIYLTYTMRDNDGEVLLEEWLGWPVTEPTV